MMHQGQARKRRFNIRYLIWMILLAGLLAFGGFRLHVHNQLQQRITELGARGYPMSLAEMNIWYRDNFSQDLDDAWPVFLDAMAAYVAFTHCLIGERCMGLHGFKASVQELIMLSSSNSQDQFLVPLIALRKVLGLHDQDMLSFINVIQAHIEAASRPRHEALARMGVVEREYRDKLGMVTRIMTPAFIRAYQFELQAVAGSLCARAALAAERYRLATGQLPDTLDELVPTFLPSLPSDPFNGQPLRFRHLDRGYVVYSVGQDLTDNQGQERRPRKARKGQKAWDETFTVAR